MIRTLRFLVFNLLSWIATVIWAGVVLLVWPFGAEYSYAVARSWTVLIAFLARTICGLRYRTVGMENFPDESCVVFLKHSSAFETYMQLVLFPRSCWVLKRELLWVPFFGWTLIPLKAIAIDRSKGGVAVRQVISQGIERLAEGINVSIFPEGTRMPAGETRRYGQSGTLLAQEAGLSDRAGCPQRRVSLAADGVSASFRVRSPSRSANRSTLPAGIPGK